MACVVARIVEACRAERDHFSRCRNPAPLWCPGCRFHAHERLTAMSFVTDENVHEVWEAFNAMLNAEAAAT